MKEQTIKTLIFSTLTAANIIIWYEIFGITFIIVLVITIGVIVLWKK